MLLPYRRSTPFYRAVRSFYVASLQKMLKKFPFGDSILKDLDIINQDKFCMCSSTTESLPKRFPQLGLADSTTLDILGRVHGLQAFTS